MAAMEADSTTVETINLQRIDSESVELYHDPIGNHMIELRKYIQMMEEKLEEREEELLNTSESSESSESSVKKRKTQKQNFPVPKFPKHYPFQHVISSLPENRSRSKYVKFVGEVPRLAEKRTTFIESVLQQTGFFLMQTPDEKALVENLSDILDEFLTKFVGRLLWNKNTYPSSHASGNLMGPLETTLRDFGFGGLVGLHSFYYNNVVKKHDILYSKCLELHARYRDDEVHHDETD